MSQSGRDIIRSSGEKPYVFMVSVLHGVNRLLCRHDWRDRDKIPARGGALLVSNHNSNYDPVVLGEYIAWSGRWGRFIGKKELWSVPVVGYFARACRQIPVERGTSHAVDVLATAKQAIDEGELVVMYPEGTITADPDVWMMTARTGAARLALENRCPVVPVATWGGNKVMPGKKPTWPRFFPRPTLSAVAGDPVVLDDLYELTDQRLAVQLATERILRAITALLEELRGEKAPEDRLDIRSGERIPWGPTHPTDSDTVQH